MVENTNKVNFLSLLKKQEKILRFILFILLFCSKFCLLGQNYHINYEHITTQEGLANNFVNHIIQDKQGFIWMATQDGLNKYDGYNFEVFKVNPAEPNGLPSNIITTLQEDTQGNIWIGTEKGLATLNIKTGKIKNLAFFENQNINNLYIDSQGRFWIVADKYHIFLLKTETDIQKVAVEYLPTNQNQKYAEFYNILERKINGKYSLLVHSMYLKNGQGYLYRFNEKKAVWQLVVSTTKKIEYIDNLGQLYFIQKQNENIKNPIIKNYNSQLTKPYHTHIIDLPFKTTNKLEPRTPLLIEKSPSQIYIFIFGKIFKINPKTGESLLYSNITPLLKQEEDEFRIKQVFKDKSKNIWMATETGIFLFPQYTLQNFKTYHNQKGGNLLGASIRAIYQDKDKNTWISTYNKEASLDIFLQDSTKKNLNIGKISFKIIPDHTQNFLWVASGSQLLKVNKQTQKVLKIYNQEDASIGYIRDILMINKEKIYLAGDEGFGVFNPQTEKLTHYSHIQVTTCIFRDKNQKIWLGSKDKGLGLLNENTMRVSYFSYEKNNIKSISSNHIKHIYEDKKGRFWIATTLGLNLFNRKKRSFTHFTEKDGLPNDMVYGILEDETNNLWLSTNKGISKFNPRTLQFINYDVSYGLQNNEFNTNSFFKNEYTGEMFFGGIKGLNSFYPENMKKNTIPPPIILTGFKRKGKKISLDEPLNKIKMIDMNYNEAQNLTFEFVALSFFQSHKNQYAYKIKEIHEEWINLDTKHEFTLTNLNAGTYTLHIKGSNNHGWWNEKGLKIILIVRPPFWQTWWFISIVVLFFLLVVYSIYRWRIYQIKIREKYLENEVNIRTEEIKTQAEVLEAQAKKLEKQAIELDNLNKAKDRFFAIIAHDLRSPITAFETIAKQLDFFLEHQEPERIKKLSKNIQRSAHTLNNLLNNLLNWALLQKNLINNQPQLLDLEDIVAEVVSYYEDTLILHNVELAKEISQGIKIYIDENALLTILRNLLNNAIKFTPKEGKIIMRGYIKDGYIFIEIEDNGIGIEAEKIPQLFKIHKISRNKDLYGRKGTGLGLLLVWEFVQANQGEIKVISKKNKGTNMQLIFSSKY